MPLPIASYALIGDCHAAGLVGLDGSLDWLCLPRFDSPACFAALLGHPEHGRWVIAPSVPVTAVRRRYREGTLIVETEFACAEGIVRLIDFMPLYNDRWDVVRIVEGVSGRVPMRTELVIRFDYGAIVPWVRQIDGVLVAIAGPDCLELRTPVAVRGEGLSTVGTFEVAAGERVPFILNYRPSFEPGREAIDPEEALVATEREWCEWSGRSTYAGPWGEAVMRSLLTLKALTYVPTGGIVAAPTTSLPEYPGGERNWDYRYCWLRDATFTLNALLLSGYQEEAVAWRTWLLRSAAGRPDDLQTMYSVTGARRLDEYEVPWLPGYGGARPVRIGNAASRQFQLDIYGEVMDTLHLSRVAGLEPEPAAWNIQRAILAFLERNWREPDEGIWEVRGPRQHFTHSKIMAWVAFDRAVRDVETFGLEGPVDRWREVRDTIHADVLARGFDAARNTFVQSYDSPHLDASLLLIPQVGFLSPDDARVRGTVEAIERHLLVHGLVERYSTATGVDALPPREGTFLPCSFWMVDALVLTGRRPEGVALFERLLGLCNDVGLLSEEYDPEAKLMLGNFPQALTHMALVNSACVLAVSASRAKRASQQGLRPGAADQST